jgi:hypothetical protein
MPRLILSFLRNQTRANTSRYGTHSIAVGRSGCACGVQKTRARWGGVLRNDVSMKISLELNQAGFMSFLTTEFRDIS